MALSLIRIGRYLQPTSRARRVKVISVSVPNRYVMTTRPRLEKALEGLKTNPYYDKYAQKIAKLQETSPEEFLQRVEEKERKIREEREKRAQERTFQQASVAKPSADSALQRKEARLCDIMKLELIQEKSKDEIGEIWKQYHRQKDCISGTMSSEQFDKLFSRAKKHTTFLLPLPRSMGYEFIICQFQGTEVHMTPLLWYQVHKENAPECLTMVHYTEFKESKDLVLMRGEFDAKSINAQEAQCLANELQLYYSTDDPKRLELLERFTEKPDEFKHMDLIAQLETISLDSGTTASIGTDRTADSKSKTQNS